MKKKNTINLILSAFLVIAFVICTYFFSTLNQSETVQNVINALVTVVFGLILFYATRVGDGKPVKRFSVATLIILVLPSLYILLTSIAPNLPLGETLKDSQMVIYLAGVALGYGIPYTFLSGFEMKVDEDESLVEGGLMEEISEDEAFEEVCEDEEVCEKEEITNEDLEEIEENVAEQQ